MKHANTLLLSDILTELPFMCPSNWGDDKDSALFWLKVESFTGVPLPDPEYWSNKEAREYYEGKVNELIYTDNTLS